MIIIIVFAAFLATLLGGLFALRLKDKLHLILGFSAGAVMAVAFFDLIPEAIQLGSGFYSNSTTLSIVAVGFLAYLVLDRLIFLHSHGHQEYEGERCDHDSKAVDLDGRGRGILGASSLSFHSFLDGVVIGLAFQVSSSVGLIVTAAVLTHDFSDGINTVNMIIKNGGNRAKAFRWLLVDAVAPVIGVVSTLFFKVPEQGLSIILAIFSGFFLYIGASDLIPESHHAHPKFLTTVMTLLGAGVLYVAIRVAGA
ncbi:MAG: ZIP family metal transporter [Candidatus Taylorbacteria bacterium]|nr:ZIP family metal transporter [Candidatus Taylorbacteria bacterium]